MGQHQVELGPRWMVSGGTKGSEHEARGRPLKPWGKSYTILSASCTLSTLHGPGGLLALLTLIPKFTGEKMQALKQGEGSPRSSVASNGGARPREQGPCQ